MSCPVIPNVGPFVAVVLPLPVLVLSPAATLPRAAAATLAPAAAHFVLGNIIEPKVDTRGDWLFGSDCCLPCCSIAVGLALVLGDAVVFDTVALDGGSDVVVFSLVLTLFGGAIG